MFIFPIGYQKAGEPEEVGKNFRIGIGTVRRIPWVTLSIVATCCIAFIPVSGFIPLPKDFNPIAQWGLLPAAPRAATYITHMFTHAGWLHLIGNMVFLFFLGGPLEDRWGRPLFGSLYLAGGLVAATTHILLTTGSAIPMVGASGAIAAVMGAFAVRFWNYRIRYGFLFLLGIFPIRGSFRAPAWLTLLLFFSMDVAGAARAFWGGQSEGIAYWAHVGGFSFGLCVAGVVSLLKVEERYIEPSIEERVTIASANPLLENAAAMREEGRLDDAYDLLAPVARGNPEDADLVLAFWDVARANHRTSDAVHVVGRLMRKLLSCGEVRLAADYWCELGSHRPEICLDAEGYAAIGIELLDQNSIGSGVDALRYASAKWVRGFDAAVALKVMNACDPADPRVALRAANRGLMLPKLTRKQRALFGQMHTELTAAGVREADDPQPVATSVTEASSVVDRDTQVVQPVRSSIAPTELPPEPTPLDLTGMAAPRRDEHLFALDEAICLPRFSGIKLMDAIPLSLEPEGLVLHLPGNKRAKLPHTKIDAVALAVVRGVQEKPILVIDLSLNWTSLSEDVLKVVRLRSDRFAPCKLMGTDAPPMEALQAMVRTLAARSGAPILPEPSDGGCLSINTYADLATYEREVLEVAG